MIVCGIEERDLRAALDVANYAYRGNLCFHEEPEPLASSHRSWRVHLSARDLDGPGCRRWVPQSWWMESWWDWKVRYTRSACWHAHRDFLYAVFERAPVTRVVTALAVYNGLANFESTYRGTGYTNVGNFFHPVLLSECCNCSEFPEVEKLVPEPYLGEYALHPGREIYSGLKPGREEVDSAR